MTVSSGTSIRPSEMAHTEISMPGRDDDDPPACAPDGCRSRSAEMVDPLTRQLRQIYGAIAEEPIPSEIAALLRRLRDS